MRRILSIIGLCMLLSGCSEYLHEQDCQLNPCMVGCDEQKHHDQCSNNMRQAQKEHERMSEIISRVDNKITKENLTCNMNSYQCTPLDTQRENYVCSRLCFNTTQDGLRKTYSISSA